MVNINRFLQTLFFFKKKKKLKEVVYLSAIQLIRRLVISSCQTTNPYPFIECLNTYLPNVHYKNPYLSTDRLRKRRRWIIYMCL